MASIRVLLAGESWVSNSTHYKGWDFFSSTVYETGEEYIRKAFEKTDIDFTHLPGHLAAEKFPLTLEDLQAYDVVILSDLGANTLLLHPDTWLHGKSVPNRLQLLADWVAGGGALIMCGGYYSFAGIYGAAKYYRSPIEEILPVKIYPFDDRVECPEGLTSDVLIPSHPLVKGMDGKWPALLGLNELEMKEGADLIVKAGKYPLLAAWDYGKGRTMIWASDIGPHWCTVEFAEWDGYTALWTNAAHWLCKK